MLSPKITALSSNDKYTKLNDIFKLSNDNLYDTDSNYNDEEFMNLDKIELEKLCSKLYTSESIDYRIYILNNLYKYHKELCNEHFDKLLVQYLYNSLIELNEQVLIKIIKESILPIDLKYKSSKLIYNEYKERINIKNKDNICYELLSFLLNESNKNESDISDNKLHKIIKLEIIQILCETYEYKSQVEQFILQYLSDINISEIKKYRDILNLAENPNTKTDHIKYIFKTICLSGILSSRYVILGAQFLINSDLFSLEEKLEVEQVIIRICRNVNSHYIIRADAADLLMIQALTETGRQIGREVISDLGRNNHITTIYDNKQNIHNQTLDSCIKKNIDIIMNTNTTNKEKELTYDETCNEIILLFCKINNIESTEKNLDINNIEENQTEIYQNVTEDDYIITKEKNLDENYIKNVNLNYIKSSLARFKLDRTKYSDVPRTQLLFVKVWNIINYHKDKDELIKRLFEELIEMSGTCSTGHSSRLVNIFSGFELNGEIIQLNIDYKSEMLAVTMAKINKKIQELSLTGKSEDEKYQSDILDEMTWNINLEKRVNLNKFIRENIMKIRDELYEEYVDEQKLIDIETFEINFHLILHKLEY